MASYDPSPPRKSGQVYRERTELLGEENQFSFLDRMLLWLGGSDAAAEVHTPAASLNKKKALGMVTAVPAVLASLSIAAFLSTQGFGPYVVLAGCVVWPLFVLAIDRALLATYSSDDPPATKRVKLVVRVSMAVLIGVIVAHPLTLWQFREMIHDQFEQIKGRRIAQLQADAELQVAKARTAGQKTLQEVKDRRADLESRYRESLIAAASNNAGSIGAEVLSKESKALTAQRTDLKAKRKAVADELALEGVKKAQFTTYLNQELASGTNDYSKTHNDTHVSRVQKFTELEQRDPVKCPRTSLFHSTIDGCEERIRGLTATLKEFDTADVALVKQEKDMRQAESDRLKRVSQVQDQGREGRIVSETKLIEQQRAENDQEYSDTSTKVARDLKNASADFDLRIEKLRRRTAPDAFQQTSILIQEVFNPSDDIDTPGSKWTRYIAGIYELTKFLFLFLILDIVPIIIKVMGGDFGTPTQTRPPSGGIRRRSGPFDSRPVPRPPGAYEIDN